MPKARQGMNYPDVLSQTVKKCNVSGNRARLRDIHSSRWPMGARDGALKQQCSSVLRSGLEATEAAGH